MIRRLRNLVTVLSLVLSAAALASWAASYRHPHSVPLFRRAREWRLVFDGGMVQLWHTRRIDVVATAADGAPLAFGEVPLDFAGGLYHPVDERRWYPLQMRPLLWPPLTRFTMMRGGAMAGDSPRYVDFGLKSELWMAPYWLVAVLPVVAASSLLARHVALRRRAQRTSRGLCGGCGYDLRATPDRCPECGAKPARGVGL